MNRMDYNRIVLEEHKYTKELSNSIANIKFQEFSSLNCMLKYSLDFWFGLIALFVKNELT